MLPKHLRLSPRNIPIVARKGVRTFSKNFTAYVCTHRAKKDSIKCAISISKKIDNKAVVRNRIKRRIRAAIISLFNHYTPEILGVKGEVKVLIVVKNDYIKAVDYENLIDEILYMTKKRESKKNCVNG